MPSFHIKTRCKKTGRKKNPVGSKTSSKFQSFSWKGRLGFRQYIPSKRSRYGIKTYKLCDSTSGYIWNCLVYTGKDTQLTEPGALYGERAVKTLLADLKNKGYNLYLDRFFLSSELASHLLQKKTSLSGTVQKNRKGQLKDLPNRFKIIVLLHFRRRELM